jgi:hypothetical protein
MFLAPNAPVRKVGSIIVIVFPLAVVGFTLAPKRVSVIAVIAAFYGGANGMITIVRGLMVPEMISRAAYEAINGALVAPMNVTLAIVPLAAAWIWSKTGSYNAVLVAIGIGAIVLCVGFWTATVLSRSADGEEKS